MVHGGKPAVHLALHGGSVKEQRDGLGQFPGLTRTHTRDLPDLLEKKLQLAFLMKDDLVIYFFAALGHLGNDPAVAATAVTGLHQVFRATQESPDKPPAGLGNAMEGGLQLLRPYPVAPLQVGYTEIFLGREMIIEAGLGNAGLLDDLIDAGEMVALAVKQPAGRFNDLFPDSRNFG